jgi:hypothetical protein
LVAVGIAMAVGAELAFGGGDDPGLAVLGGVAGGTGAWLGGRARRTSDAA